MSDLCHLKGTLVSPTGAPLRGAQVDLQLMPDVVQPSGDQTLVPAVVTVTTSYRGALSANLMPGIYDVKVTSWAPYHVYKTYRIAVPAEAEADIADLTAMPPIAPVYMDELRDLVRRIEDAAGTGGGGGPAYDDSALVARVVALEDAPAPTWDEVAEKPEAFAPSAHRHGISEVDGLEEALASIPAPAEPYDDSALSTRVSALENAASPTPYDDAALREMIAILTARVAALEGDSEPEPTEARNVILVTDYAGDCDDAPAVLMACQAHEDGDINLLGIVVSSTVPTSAPGVYGQLAAYNMTDIPVYAYQGSVGSYNNRVSAPVRDLFGVAGQTRSAFVDDVTGLRTMLAGVPDGSVKIIDIGAPVSTSRLLESPADATSPMTGRELVAAKVSGMWIMAGEFASGRAEYNADRDPASTKNVYETWPTPIVAHGGEVGISVYTGPRPDASAVTDPVKVAFDAYGTATPGSLKNGKRSSWDPICVDHAIYGDQALYRLAGESGTITVSSTGVTTWAANPAGNRSYVGKAVSDADVGTALQAKIDATAVEQNPDASAPAQVSKPVITGSTSSRQIAWVRPDSGGSPITQYVLRLDGTTIATVPGNEFSYTHNNIAVGDHSLTVLAVNQIGAGTPSEAATFTVQEAPPAGVPTIVFALNEGTGTTVASQKGDTGAITGATWLASPARLSFDGVDDRLVTAPPATEYDLSDAIFSAIVRYDVLTGTKAFMSRNGTINSGSRSFFFRNNTNKLEWVSFDSTIGGTVLSSAAGVVVVGEWAMFTAFQRTTDVSLRKNGVDLLKNAAHPATNRTEGLRGVPIHWGCRFNASINAYADFIDGDILCGAYKFGAVEADIATVEAQLRQIAANKGVTIA